MTDRAVFIEIIPRPEKADDDHWNRVDDGHFLLIPDPDKGHMGASSHLFNAIGSC